MLSKWTWKCPVEGCEHHGSKPCSHTTCGNNGRKHLESIHKLFNVEPIYIKVKEYRVKIRGTDKYEP